MGVFQPSPVTSVNGMTGDVIISDVGGMADPGANGILSRIALDTTTARTITGTTNQVTVTNGDGVAGNPTISLPQNIHTGASPTFASLALTRNTNADLTIDVTNQYTGKASSFRLYGQSYYEFVSLVGTGYAGEQQWSFGMFGTNGFSIQNNTAGTYALVINASNNITTIGGFAANVAPTADSTYTLGTSSLYWSNTYTDRLYLNSTAYLDGGTAGQTNVTGRFSVPNYGSNNQIIGSGAGNASQTGTYNVGMGDAVLDALTSGSYNMAFGAGALGATTTGERNVAIGAFSMDVNTTGSSNVGLGQDSLGSNTSGGSNIAVGTYSMLSNSTGNENVAIGQSARESGTGGGNVAIGHEAAKQRTSGNDNVFIGIRAGFSAATSSGSVFIGANAGANETASNKLYIANSNTAAPLIGGDFSSNTIITPASIEITDTAKGVILKSPDGTRYRLTVANGGTLTIAAA